MSTLLSIQQNLQEHLLNPDSNNISSDILGSEKFTKQERLKVYSNAYKIRLINILKDDFPKLHTLLGDTQFDKLANDYLDANPSRYFSARFVGEKLSEFLKITLPYKNFASLREMAEFEWTIGLSLDALDKKLYTLEKLQSIGQDNWPELKFNLHPSASLMHLAYDTAMLWQDIENNQKPRQPKLLPNPQDWLIWRQGIVSHYQSLDYNQSLIIHSIKNNLSFADICNKLALNNQQDKVPSIALSVIIKLINEGILTE